MFISKMVSVFLFTKPVCSTELLDCTGRNSNKNMLKTNIYSLFTIVTNTITINVLNSLECLKILFTHVNVSLPLTLLLFFHHHLLNSTKLGDKKQGNSRSKLMIR